MKLIAIFIDFKKYIVYYASSLICLSGETGIRTALKMLRPMSCRFESDLRHQLNRRRFEMISSFRKHISRQSILSGFLLDESKVAEI